MLAPHQERYCVSSTMQYPRDTISTTAPNAMLAKRLPDSPFFADGRPARPLPRKYPRRLGAPPPVITTDPLRLLAPNERRGSRRWPTLRGRAVVALIAAGGLKGAGFAPAVALSRNAKGKGRPGVPRSSGLSYAGLSRAMMRDVPDLRLPVWAWRALAVALSRRGTRAGSPAMLPNQGGTEGSSLSYIRSFQAHCALFGAPWLAHHAREAGRRLGGPIVSLAACREPWRGMVIRAVAPFLADYSTRP